jgi:hypothetical protein
MFRLRRYVLRHYRFLSRHIYSRGLLLLIVLLFCDGLAGLFAPQIHADLSLPLSVAQRNTGISAFMVAPPISSQSVLAIDTFQRSNQTYWGNATSGQTWLADANTARNFAISQQAGVISVAQNATCNAVLGPVVTNSEVTFSASLNRYGPSTLGAVLRWSDPNDFYKVMLTGQNLIVVRAVDGMVTPLQEIPFPVRNGAAYTFRFSAIGSQLSAMVWPTGQPAPLNWQISLVDSALTSGRAGLSVLAQDRTQAQITTFMEVEA